MFALAIIGSSTLNRTQYHAAEVLVDGLVRRYISNHGSDNLMVVSGGALGVDSIVEAAANAYSLYTRIFRPTEKQWSGPSGYRDRNIKIAENCDELVRIGKTASSTYGSGWTADYAERIGVPVMRYWV